VADKEVKIVVKAQDKATKVLKKLGQTMKTALKAGALAAGVAVAGLGAAAIKMGLEFEKGFAEVQTLLPDLNKKGIGELRKGILSFSKEMGIATTQAVPALYSAISASVPPKNVLSFMETAAKASVGGVTDLETAVDGLTSVVNAYGSANIDAGRASDIMFTAVKLGKTTMGELSSSLFNVVPIAAATGVKFEEVAAGLAALTAQGVPTTVAATQLRAAIQAMSAPTVRQKKIMEELGLSFSAAEIQQKGLLNVFREAIEATGGNMEVLRKLIGSVEGLQAVLALGGEQSGIFEADLLAMADSAGATDKAFQTMADTAGFKLNKAINSLKVTLTEIGLQVLPTLAIAMEGFIGFLEEHDKDIKQFVDEFFTFAREAAPQIIDAIAEFKGILDKVLPPIIKIGDLIGGWPRVIGLVAAAFVAMKIGGLALSFGALATKITTAKLSMLAMKAGPMVALTAGFIALPPLIDAVKNSFSDADNKARALGFGVEFAAGAINDSLNPVGSAIGEMIRLRLEYTNTLDEMENSFRQFDVLEDQWEHFDETQAGVIQSLVDSGATYDQVMRAIKNTGVGSFEPVIAIVADMEEGLANYVLGLQAGGATSAEVFQAVKDTASQNVPAVRQLLFDLEEQIMLGDIKALKELKREAEASMPEVASAIVTNTQLAQEAFTAFMEDTAVSTERIAESIGSLLPAVDESFDGWAQRMKDMATDILAFGDNLQIIYDKLIEANVEGADALLLAIETEGPIVAAALAEEFGDKPVEELDEALGNLSTIVNANLVGAGAAVVAAGPSFAADLERLGIDGVHGFSRGFRSIDLNAVAEQEMIDFKKSMRDSIDAKSPSKDLMKIGADAMEGFLIGLSSKKANLEDAIMDITRALSVSLDEGMTKSLTSARNILIGQLQDVMAEAKEIAFGGGQDMSEALSEGSKAGSEKFIVTMEEIVAAAMTPVIETIRGPMAEVLNGLDDDLDGLVDEGLLPLVEVLNGLDDDLDGLIDEGLNGFAEALGITGVALNDLILNADSATDALLLLKLGYEDAALAALQAAAGFDTANTASGSSSGTGSGGGGGGAGSGGSTAGPRPGLLDAIITGLSNQDRGTLMTVAAMSPIGRTWREMVERLNDRHAVLGTNAMVSLFAGRTGGAALLQSIRNFGMLNFKHGGTVPGPIGAPVPVIAHGGERFLGARRQGGSGGHITFNIYALDGDSVRRVIPEIARELDKHQRNTGGGGLL
jgi:TP901 family phage tail tape measure protein